MSILQYSITTLLKSRWRWHHLYSINLSIVEWASSISARLKKLELLSATPRATLTHLSCSPNLPRASYLDERTLMYEPIVNESLSKESQMVINEEAFFLFTTWLIYLKKFPFELIPLIFVSNILLDAYKMYERCENPYIEKSNLCKSTLR